MFFILLKNEQSLLSIRENVKVVVITVCGGYNEPSSSFTIKKDSDDYEKFLKEMKKIVNK